MQKDGDYEVILGKRKQEDSILFCSQICLDNKMSAFSDKVVWFEVTVHDPKDDYYDDYIGEELDNNDDNDKVKHCVQTLMR